MNEVYLEMHTQHGWQLLNAQLLDGFLRRVALRAAVLPFTELLLGREALEAVVEIEDAFVRVVGGADDELALLEGLVAQVEGEVEEWVKGGCGVLAFGAGYRRVQFARESLVYNAGAICVVIGGVLSLAARGGGGGGRRVGVGLVE